MNKKGILKTVYVDCCVQLWEITGDIFGIHTCSKKVVR